jgi:crossover junction endodeoxyribonuclease RuvC
VRILGVDPGLSGAVAILDTKNDTLDVCDMPLGQITLSSGKKRNELNDAALACIIKGYKPDCAVLEIVSARPGEGVSSVFRFGASWGVVRGILATLEIPVDMMRPQEWQTKARLPRGDHAAILRASQVFPHAAHHFARKMDHGRADAALMAWVKAQSPF